MLSNQLATKSLIYLISKVLEVPSLDACKRKLP